MIPTSWRVSGRASRNGSQPECISDYGVADLPGNVDEVVSSEHQRDPSFEGKFDSVHTGGPWYKGVRNQCRPKIYTHDEGFYYYFLGFRCCAEPDGKPTEPRTPRQMKEGWKLVARRAVGRLHGRADEAEALAQGAGTLRVRSQGHPLQDDVRHAARAVGQGLQVVR